ncbi:orotate phosphoribosyltransferase [Stetteria hydrogenophila]
MGRALDSIRRTAAGILVESGAFMVGEFRLASGRVSRYYVDVRRVWGDPLGAARLVNLALALVRVAGLGFDVVAGVATGGIPFASMLALELEAPLAYVRVERKDHGLGRMVEGASVEGSTVLVVDDVATTGGSIGRAVEAVRAQGGVVRDALVVVDRGEGARERLEGLNVRLWSLTTLRDILEYAGVEEGA